MRRIKFIEYRTRKPWFGLWSRENWTVASASFQNQRFVRRMQNRCNKSLCDTDKLDKSTVKAVYCEMNRLYIVADKINQSVVFYGIKTVRISEAKAFWYPMSIFLLSARNSTAAETNHHPTAINKDQSAINKLLGAITSTSYAPSRWTNKST